MSSSIAVQASPSGPAAPAKRRSRGRMRAFFLHTRRGQFTVQTGLILLMAAIITLTGAIALSLTSSDLAKINDDSIRSIDAAQAITQYVEDIDAKSADYLATAGLTYVTSCYIAGSYSGQLLSVHDCDERNIDAETVLANQELYKATHNVTYAGERTAVERISTGLESYLEDIHQMRVDFASATSKTDPKDPNLQKAYQAYQQAEGILYTKISLTTTPGNEIPFDKEQNLPACAINGVTIAAAQWTQGSLTQALDCLRVLNYTPLNQTYQQAATFLTAMTVVMIALCLIFCIILLFTTGFMMRNTHRIVNPGLVAASLLAVIFSVYIIGLFAQFQGQNQSKTQDGTVAQLVVDDYDNIYSTTLLKRYATEANADKSRWLIAQEFQDTANIQRWQNDWDNNIKQIQSLMQGASQNQIWSEAAQPVANMNAAWSDYASINNDIHTALSNTSRSNPLLDAEEISTWQSNWAFKSYTDALDSLSNANRTHYTQTFNATHASLQLYLYLCLSLFPLAGLAAAWGIWSRLRDF